MINAVKADAAEMLGQGGTRLLMVLILIFPIFIFKGTIPSSLKGSFTA
jgi:hypothetical protein